MTKKNLDYWKEKAISRNHTLISLTGTGYRNKKVSIKCSCGCVFETSTSSYENSKNGCPDCKKSNTSIRWLGAKRKSDSEKVQTKISKRLRRKREAMDENSVFAKITNQEELLTFLKANSNVYNYFIYDWFEKLKDHKNIPPVFELHHIIPFHDGGCNQDWNVIKLSPENHRKAHSLRYLVYEQVGDSFPLVFISQMSKKEVKTERSRIGIETQRKNQLGRFSSQQQAESGRLGGKKQTENKVATYIKRQGPEVRKWLEKGSTWILRKGNGKEDQVIVIDPCVVRLVYEFQPIFISFLEGDKQTALINVRRTTFSSALARVLRGERPSYYGFSLSRV